KSARTPMSVVEFDDLHGNFECPLVGKDYEDYQSCLLPGKVYLVIGSRSQYNNNEDNLLRIVPKQIISFEELPEKLKGQIQISFEIPKLNSKLRQSIKTWKNRARGKFSLATEALIDNDEQISLLSNHQGYFPDDAFCELCKKNGIHLKIRMDLSEK
ncbi:MAG: hypothetical protein PHI68_06830, partial [Candidatus Cloacimonetes bacterium]|nr:hypothetical protein [Candidatus Cloacimonadota bacterium]